MDPYASDVVGRRPRRARALPKTFLVVAVVCLMSAAVAIPASAGHPKVDAPGGPYNGFSTASTVHIDAVTSGDNRLIDFELGVTNSAVDSEGLNKVLSEYERPIVPGGLGASHSRGHSTVLEVGALLNPPDAENQVKPWVAEAKNGEPAVNDVVASQSVGTAAHFDLLRRQAEANWNADTCVIGEPIAAGQQHLARAELLDTAANEGTVDFDKPVLALDAEQFGPKRTTTHTISLQQLYKGSGPGLGLSAASTSTLAPVTLLQGTENEFTLEFDGPGQLAVFADGTPGGTKVVFNLPVVTLIRGGERQTLVPDSPITILDPVTQGKVASIKVGVLEALSAPKGLGGDATKNSAGTRAAAVGNIVEIKLLNDLPVEDFRGLTIALGHMEVGAEVPAGGIECPIPVTKVANPPSVSVEDLFTVTITAHNPFSCKITGLAIADSITTEDDARFEIVSTSPTADTITNGQDLSSGEAEWNNLGDLAPGASKSVKITLQAQGGAGRILDTATASGTLTNCPAQPGGADADVTALANATVPVDGSVSLVVPESRVLGEVFLPKTGLPAAVPAGLGLLAIAALGALTSLRRRTGI